MKEERNARATRDKRIISIKTGRGEGGWNGVSWGKKMPGIFFHVAARRVETKIARRARRPSISLLPKKIRVQREYRRKSTEPVGKTCRVQVRTAYERRRQRYSRSPSSPCAGPRSSRPSLSSGGAQREDTQRRATRAHFFL